MKKKIFIILFVIIFLLATNVWAIPEEEARTYIGKTIFVGVIIDKQSIPVNSLRRYKGEAVAIRRGIDGEHYLILFINYFGDVMIECDKIAYIREVK